MKKLAVVFVAVLGVVLAGVPAAGAQQPTFVNFDSVGPDPVEAGTPVAVQVSYTMGTVSAGTQLNGSVSAGTITGFAASPDATLNCTPTATTYSCDVGATDIYQVTYQVDTTGLADGTTITLNAGETGIGVTQQTTVQVESQQPPDTEPPDTEPPDTEPPATDPADTDPANTDPADTDPADTDPADTDPSDTSETGASTTAAAAATTTGSGTTSGQLPSTGPGLTSLTSALLGGLLLGAGGLALRLARRS